MALMFGALLRNGAEWCPHLMGYWAENQPQAFLMTSLVLLQSAECSEGRLVGQFVLVLLYQRYVFGFSVAWLGGQGQFIGVAAVCRRWSGL